MAPVLDLRLHHVGVVVAEIASAGEAYCRRLGYQVESPVIHDPRQAACVQFLRLPGDSVFLELVAPDTPASPLQAALAKGQPLHHLCYSTGDIEAACEELRRRGMTLICPPAPAVAFQERRIAWLMGRDRGLTELVEAGAPILREP